MMARKDGVGQIIKASVTVVTLVALTGGFRVIKTTLDDLFGLTRGAGDTVRPASFAYGLITLNLIDQILDVDLHRWTPVRGWNMGSHQYTTSSNSTTLESNKSVQQKMFANSHQADPDNLTFCHTFCVSHVLNTIQYRENTTQNHDEVLK